MILPKIKLLLPLLVALLLLPAAGSAFAFNDLNGNPAKAAIEQLERDGIVSGVDEHSFKPNESMTNAQAVHLIVKGMKLNIDHIRFIKEPLAGDYFTNVPNDAWYAQSFIVAQLNGLPLAKDIDPSKPITRELFADLLFHALLKTGDYAFIELFVVMKDGDEVTEGRMESIQKLLIAKIAKLDENGKFYPQKAVTRGEAAAMLHAAIVFVKEHSTMNQPDPEHTVTVSSEKVNDEVNKVTLSWGTRPNPGYRLTIDGIAFTGNEAVISYSLHTPEPGRMYPQVITEAKASTFVASSYNVTIKQAQ
ncbi:S-layer homology domain-containing protein [Paenibacillus sp. MBLB4367]|uniref:S-layer homology domain-containing protein n=1 Tax=Paenibacillus sp. MBLB4367 TaxID=3384767 RepID=UPI003907ED85